MDLRAAAAKLTIDQVAELLARDFQSQQKLESLDKRLQDLSDELREKDRFLAWFRKQFFGARSERRILDVLPLADQLWLGQQMLDVPEAPPPPATSVKSYERAHRQAPTEVVDSDSRLRFDESVPVEEIPVANPELADLTEEDLKLISEEVTYRLAQRSSYVVLKYVRKVVKRKDTGEICRPAAPPAVIDRSFADVSFLAGMVVDKFQHHLPLYRQHQRLEQAGIFVARSTLTRLIHRVGELLEPIYLAQQSSILLSQVLTVDESPTPAGRAGGRMKTGYFWALYGDQDEVGFLFSPTRARRVLDEALAPYSGVLLCDGYSAYESFAQARADVSLAQCWSHTRRNFLEAEQIEPLKTARVLSWIQQLYQVEERARGDLDGLARLRGEVSKPIVTKIFEFLQQELDSTALLPSNLFVKAAEYAIVRAKALRLFLDNPAIPIDTNHVERTLRPPAVGRKNWMFHVTEVGARYAAIFYSLIQSCILNHVNPNTYLTDVLQRIDTHPAADVDLLTPRLWRDHFGQQPMRSVLSA